MATDENRRERRLYLAHGLDEELVRHPVVNAVFNTAWRQEINREAMLLSMVKALVRADVARFDRDLEAKMNSPYAVIAQASLAAKNVEEATPESTPARDAWARDKKAGTLDD